MVEAAASDLLLAPWTGPHRGAPPFDRVRVEDFEPALMAGMAEQRAEIARIVADGENPTFDNTIAALERSGRALNRAGAVFGVWASTLNDKAMQAVEQAMSPVFAAFDDEVIQNAELFRRIQAVFQGLDGSNLTDEQRRLTTVTYRRFARRGAALGPAEKARLGTINQRLATLTTTFSQNVLADEEGAWLTLETIDDLAGLPNSMVAGRRGRGGREGARRQVGDHQQPIGDGAVPDLLHPPRPARGGLAAVGEARRHGGCARQQPPPRRDPAASGREGPAARTAELRPLDHRRPDGEDSGRRPRSDDEGVGAGQGQGRRTGGGTGSHRRRGSAGGDDRAVGLSPLRRDPAPAEVRPR